MSALNLVAESVESKARVNQMQVAALSGQSVAFLCTDAIPDVSAVLYFLCSTFPGAPQSWL